MATSKPSALIISLRYRSNNAARAEMQKSDRPSHVSRALNFATSDTHVPPGWRICTITYPIAPTPAYSSRSCAHTLPHRLAIMQHRRECVGAC